MSEEITDIKEVVKEPEVKINPFLAANNEPSLDELCLKLNPILEKAEEQLKNYTKMYNISPENPQVLKASKIEYVPTITESSADSFNLKNPRAALKVEYKPRSFDCYVDRVWLTPDDVKFLLQNEKEVQNIFNDLVTRMFENLVKTKNLKTGKLYYGTTIAALKTNKEPTSYCSNIRDDYVEIRIFSNATDLEGNVEDDVSGKDTQQSETSQIASSN